MEGFCGRNCDNCTWRAEQGCLGCGDGPGRPLSGDCAIAACCREKGHERCDTCSFLAGCHLRNQHAEMPQCRQERLETERARKQWFSEQAPHLGKWLWLLFWLVIPNVIANIMTNENIVALAPGLRVPGEILSFLCGLAYAFILWQLRGQGSRYRTAAVCGFVAAGANGLAALLTGDGSSPGGAALALVILIPAMVVSLYGTYQEYNAHAEVLDGLDDGLAENWRKLWKWEIGFLLGLFGCILLVMISAVLGMLALIAVLIGMIVVAVLKLVYLWRMAKLFREYMPCE